MAPDRDIPDFSFLHEGPREGDSSVLTSDSDSASKSPAPPSKPPASAATPPAPKPQPPAPAATNKQPPAPAKPAADAGGFSWMDQAAEQSAHDSGTRFAAALQGGQENRSHPLFNFDEQTEAIDLKADEQGIGEETLVDEQLAAPREQADDSNSLTDAKTADDEPGSQTEQFDLADEPDSAAVNAKHAEDADAAEAFSDDHTLVADEDFAGPTSHETAVWRKENVADAPAGEDLSHEDLSAEVASSEETIEYESADEWETAAEVDPPASPFAADSAAETVSKPATDLSPTEDDENSVPPTAEIPVFTAEAASAETPAARPAAVDATADDTSSAAIAASAAAALSTAAATASSFPSSTASRSSSRSSRSGAANRAGGKTKDGKSSSDFKNLLLISYASAITLVCIYLVMQSLNAKPHELESLPDLIPPIQNDEIAYRLAPEDADMPKGHTLKLGDSRRFGNVLVTPLRVEKAPVQFEHFTGDPSRKRAASPPVLKLWVKFENVSRDQKFAPLDRELLLSRIVDARRPEYERSNQFVAPASAKGNLDATALLFNLEKVGDWNFAGLPDQPTLAPGESIELYLPASEAASEHVGEPLIWRVQFRKGYHPQSFRGVTTLIEIQIDPSQIQSV